MLSVFRNDDKVSHFCEYIDDVVCDSETVKLLTQDAYKYVVVEAAPGECSLERETDVRYGPNIRCCSGWIGELCDQEVQEVIDSMDGEFPREELVKMIDSILETCVSDGKSVFFRPMRNVLTHI